MAYAEWQKENSDISIVEKLLLEGLHNNMSLLGQNNLSTAYCFDDLCSFYLQNNEILKSKIYGAKAIVIYKKFLGERHQFTKSLVEKYKKIEQKLDDI